MACMTIAILQRNHYFCGDLQLTANGSQEYLCKSGRILFGGSLLACACEALTTYLFTPVVDQ